MLFVLQASLITLNVNLNTPGEEASYGPLGDDPCIYFLEDNGGKHNVSFTPGMALLHLGVLRHAAYPIQLGERVNLLVWLFGHGGYVRVAPYPEEEWMSRQERWSRPPSSASNRRDAVQDIKEL
jgi:hypothetical protein